VVVVESPVLVVLWWLLLQSQFAYTCGWQYTMNDDIVEAISKAKYNETVQVTVNYNNCDDSDDNDEQHETRRPRQLLLAASLDPDNGGLTWNDVGANRDENDSDNGDGDDEAIRRHLRTKKWIFPMLNDHTRNKLYQEAIERASADVVRRFATGRDDNDTNVDNVLRCLDIGSGTGLLAMLSARSLQKCWEDEKSKKGNIIARDRRRSNIVVKSLEMSTPMAKMAQRIISRNGFAGVSHDDKPQDGKFASSTSQRVNASIEIIEGHSCEIPPTCDFERFHLCTSELLESGLLGEGWLTAIRDAWERHLQAGSVVVPQRARVFARVIADHDCVHGNGNDDNAHMWRTTSLEDYTGPYQVLEGFPKDRSMRLFTTSPGERDRTLDGIMMASGLQISVGVDLSLQADDSSTGGIQYLSDPIQVLELDVTSKERIPSAELHSSTKHFICTASGRAKGVVFWWELDLYDDLTYSTRPGALPWQDHWHPCVFLISNEDSIMLDEGQSACITTHHDDTRISFAVDTASHADSGSGTDPKRPRISTSQSDDYTAPTFATPQRCLQLNSNHRLTLLRDAISATLDHVGRDKARVLDVSDFSLCGIMSSLLGARYVTSLESSTGPNALAIASARVAQFGNNLSLSAAAENDNQNRFQIIQCHPEQVSAEVLVGGEAANMAVAEPSYQILEGWTQGEALNMFYHLRGMKRRGALDDDAVCVPKYARIMAQAFQAPDLGGAYKQCNTKLCGFDHGTLNEFWSLDKNCVSHSVWNSASMLLSQHSIRKPLKSLTEPAEIATLDYQHNVIHRPSSTKAKYNNEGTCHIIVSWVDYHLPTTQTDWTNRNQTDSEDTIKHKQTTKTLSTNSNLYNQSVFVLPKPVDVTESDIQNGLTIELGHVFTAR
jgi:type III protein arginine methyltransferase